MSDRSLDRPDPGPWMPPPADATRDITLPPLPGRPAPAVPPEWSRYLPLGERPASAGAPPAPPPSPPFDLPTDRLVGPGDRPRSSTLSFQPPPQVQLLKVSVGPRRSSRLLWTVLILLPLLIIAGSGIWLVVLFYGG